MNEHPYWTLMAVYTGLLTLALLGLLVVLFCLAWTKWQHAREQRRRDAGAFVPDPEFEAEHKQLLAENGDQQR